MKENVSIRMSHLEKLWVNRIYFFMVLFFYKMFDIHELS